MADLEPIGDAEEAVHHSPAGRKPGTHADDPPQPEAEILSKHQKRRAVREPKVKREPSQTLPEHTGVKGQTRETPAGLETKEIVGLVVAFLAVVLVFFVAAPTAAGVIDMTLARMLLLFGWSGSMVAALVLEFLSKRSRQRIAAITVLTGLIVGALALYGNYWIGKKKAEQDRDTHSATPTQAPTLTQAPTPMPTTTDHSSRLPTIQPSPSETPRSLRSPSPLIPETVQRSPALTPSATPAPRISPTHSVFLGADPQIGLIECYIKGEDDRGIHGATVTAHNDKTNRDYVGTTNSAGEARIQVAVGSYTVTVKAQGYAMQTGASTVSGYEKGFIQMVLVKQ